jgi:hypothetical protein
MSIVNDLTLNFTSQLYQVSKENLKNLSQLERKYCMSTLQSFAKESAFLDKEKAQIIVQKIQRAKPRKQGLIHLNIAYENVQEG